MHSVGEFLTLQVPEAELVYRSMLTGSKNFYGAAFIRNALSFPLSSVAQWMP